MNALKVGLLMTAITALLVFCGRLAGGTSGMVMALGFALLMNMGSYWFSDKIVLMMYRAQPLDPQSAPGLFQMTSNLAQRAGIPMPKLYVIPDPQPNAFATGRSPRHSAVAVNQGLLDMLDGPEVEGVIAHELAHIKHRDTLTMAIIATVAGAIMVLSDIVRWGMILGTGRDEEDGVNPIVLLAMTIVAPLAAMLIQLGVSRAREYEADATAARIVGTPVGLMNALTKLERGVALVPSHATPQTAHMFIVNPFGKAGGFVANMFRTHPSTEDRVARLRELAVGGGRVPLS